MRAPSLAHRRNEVIIESPFMTVRRVSSLLPVLAKVSMRGVRIVINTRDPREHEGRMHTEAVKSMELLERAGAIILLTGGHHRKLAIFDRAILHEGSLNILSQDESCEIMRRIESEGLAREMIEFVGIGGFTGYGI